jgi:hypothetical protein
MKFYKYEDALLGAETKDAAAEYYTDVIADLDDGADALEELTEEEARKLISSDDKVEFEEGIAGDEPFMIFIH